MTKIVDIAPQLEPLFPIGAPPFEVHVVAGATGEWVRAKEPTAIATVRTIIWDRESAQDEWRVRDIKEQELTLGWPTLFENQTRVAAFVAALAAVLADADLDALDEAMPSDILRADVLKLERASTQADFEAALRTKSRLGPYLRGG